MSEIAVVVSCVLCSRYLYTEVYESGVKPRRVVEPTPLSSEPVRGDDAIDVCSECGGFTTNGKSRD